MAASNPQSELRNILFRCNPVPMFLYDNRSLRILAANDAATVRYGYTGREFRAMTLAGLRPSGDDPALEQPAALDPAAPPRTLWTHATKQGTPFLVELRAVPFPHCSRRLRLLSAIDVSPCHEARQKLIHTAQLNRTLVEECPYGIYRFNVTTRRYEHANPALLDLLGYTLQEFCDLNHSLFSDLSERDAYLAGLHASGSLRDIETRLRSRDGRLLRVSISCSLCVNPETGHEYILSYVRDTTRQHELEEQFDHTRRMEAVGRFAGGIAHDFNNITQSISLSCELALHAPLPPAIQSKLYGILAQATRAAEITQQLLAFSRLQLLQPRVVSLNECIRGCLPMLHRALGSAVSIELNLEEALAPIVIDPDQLNLVLVQLADNASAAMPIGGILRISTEGAPPAPPQPDGIPSEPCAILTIADTGIGMDESTRRRIFEPFFSTKTTTHTTGLGLSTVHGIVHQSNGRIECESALGRGATFRIFLPIAATLPAAAPVPRCRLLLAEDDPLVNKHLAQALREAGFTVHPVPNGEEALAAFAAQPFQIVVTDIVMPKLSGVELTRRLRQLVPNLPVVLISGYSEHLSVLENLPHNQIAFLQKPFASATLIAVLRNLLASAECGPPPPPLGECGNSSKR